MVAINQEMMFRRATPASSEQSCPPLKVGPWNVIFRPLFESLAAFCKASVLGIYLLLKKILNRQIIQTNIIVKVSATYP